MNHEHNPSSDPNNNPELVKQVVAEAMNLPERQRSEFIAGRCRGDQLLQAEIETLVAALQNAGNFMNAVTGSAGATKSTDQAPHEAVGRSIGPYKLLQLIGEGGFGSVFLADQLEPVRRRVALKIIKLGMDTKQVVARFEQERQALAIMDHPNIARVFDAGATELGRPYFVMEYVKGLPITEYCDAQKFTIRERLDLFMQVCRAVQHAHTKGVIHRDLKPRNVLVSTHDGRPHAKVIDFGIAKATAQRMTEKTLFTEHQQLIGTLEYMSPEQAEGSIDIDTRTDVYSLGVLLYELLTDATPFEGKRLRSAAYAEVRRIIKEEEPPKPSVMVAQRADSFAATAAARRTEPNKLGTLIKGELDWIVMKALDKDRARRYESPNQLAADIQRHLSGEAVVAASPTVGYRVRKFVKKNKGKVFAASAMAAVVVIGGGIAAWQWFRAEGANMQLRDEVKRARLAEADAVIARISTWCAERQFGSVLPEMPSRFIRDQAVKTKELELGADSPDAIEARFLVGEYGYLESEGEECLQMMVGATQRRENQLTDPDRRLLSMWCILADAQVMMFHWEDAELLYSKIAESARGVLRRDGSVSLYKIPLDSWNGPTGGSRELEVNGENDGNNEMLYNAIERYRSAHGIVLRTWISEWITRSLEYSYQGEQSEATYEDAVKNARRAIEADGGNIQSHFYLAAAFFRLANYSDALTAITRAADLRSQAGQPARPADLAILAMTHFKLGHGGEARAMMVKLRAEMQEKKPPIQPGASQLQESSSEDPDASALLREAEELIESDLPASGESK